MKAVALSLLLFTAVLASNMATDSNKKDFDEFKKIDSTEFGKSLFDTIQLEFKTGTGDALKTVRSMLNDMLHNLLAEAKKDSEDSESRQDDCSISLNAIQTQKHDAATSKADANLDKNIDEEEFAASGKELDEKSDNVAELRKALDNLDALRDAEREATEDQLQEWNDLRNTLVEAQGIIRVLLSEDGSFLQVQNNSTDIALQAQNKVKSLNLNSGYAKSLAQLATFATSMLQRTSVDQPLVQRVVTVIDDILQKFEELELEAKRQDVVNELTYQARRAEISDLIYSLQSDVARLTAEQTELDAAILKLSNDINRFTSTLEQKSKEYDDQYNSCKNFNDQYNDRVSARSEQIAVLKQTIAVIDKKLAPFKEYISERTGGAGDDVEYEAEYEGNAADDE